jgi:glycosyltransferase involved in cell wall biosynthesis
VSSAPSISVALVTRNRPDSLERTLASLRAQARQPAEVLVSDDSDPEHAGHTQEVALRHGCRYARGPGRGLYANRNAAALACGGTHVRTMDDDHEFPAGHWEACEAAVVGDPASVWIIGEVVPSEALWATDRVPGELQPRGFAATPRDPDDTWALADGASIFPSAIFRAGVRYSEAFRFGAGYLEFGSRLHRLGYRIRYLRGTHVVHHYDVATRSWQDREEDLAAKCFATISHSFAYQPTLRNRSLTTAEIVRDLARTRGMGVRALRRGYRAYRAQRRAMDAVSATGGG